MSQEEFDIRKHILVPEHIKLSEDEKNNLLAEKNLVIKQLPKILLTDPAIKHLDPKIGDIILIKRKSPTSGQTNYYRVVVSG